MALTTASLLLSGCATPPVALDATSGPLVSGRFGLKASFLPEPTQGRFEWRWRGDQDHEVWIQDPWGQVQGIFRRSGARPGPWAGWSLTDGRGRPLLPESRGDWSEVSGMTPESLQALADMLDTLGERLRPSARDPAGVAGAAVDPPPAFSLRHLHAGHRIELRIAIDRANDLPESPRPADAPACRPPAPC